MSFTHKERHALRERQKIIDAKASETGQKEARRYLAAREQPPTQGRIREFLAALITGATIVIGVIFLAIGLAP